LPSQNIDIAIRSSQSLEDSSLTSQKLFEMRRVVVASPAYLASNKAPLTPENINLHACLNFKHRGLYDRWKYHDNNDQQVLQTNTLVSANSYAALKTLCLNNMGLVRLFEYQVADEIERGELVRVMGNLDWGKQSIHAVYHGKMSDSPKVKAFLHYFSAINS
jgi:DNA-binding transcriptional LysR family regulator